MTIGYHSEIRQFAVTNLGKSDIFIGHNWLYHHNPEIDWTTGKIKFTRCPLSCGYEEPMVDNDLDLEDGDRIWVKPAKPSQKIRRSDFMVRAFQSVASRLAEKETKDKTAEKVPDQYSGFEEVFEQAEFKHLPPRRTWDHAIELKPGTEPNGCKIYPLNPAEQSELDTFLDEHLKSRHIRPSKSPMASPFFFVKKKDGRLRPVQDYRKLNEIMIKNRYPLPLIPELVDKLKGAKYFSKLDVRWGYNNIRIKEGDEWKVAFLTNHGLFEPLVMYFGLTNSPATFQTMMDELLRDLIQTGKVLVYMDDILIFTKDLDEHHRLVQQVLKIFKDNKLYLKPEKCDWEKTWIEYLGLIISENMVEMDPVKVKGISDWPEPKKLKEFQSFLGFCNFYQRFVKDYSKMCLYKRAIRVFTITGSRDNISDRNI